MYLESSNELVFASTNSIVVRATRKSDGKSVILKKPASKFPEKWHMESFRVDFNITKSLHKLHPDHFLNHLELIESENGTCTLVEEDIGEGLSNLLGKTKKFNTKEFLKLAIDMASALSLAHSHHVIHRDVKVSNFIVDSKSHKPKLIDFGISVITSRKSPFVSCPFPIGTFAYMSPEQTGRVSMKVDSRSDIYSLGITFYEMLTGGLPFHGDKLGLVHSQITKKIPTMLEVPEVLNGMVQKMCAKNPKERYQTAYGVQKDLEHFLENLENLPKEFKFAEKDVKQFEISDNMYFLYFFIISRYGRGKELNELKKLVLDVENQTRLCFVVGNSGSGKSRLIEELSKDPSLNAMLAYGKFDQFNRTTPYSGFIV
jgi:histidine kinase